jgi:hypothetical protein
MTTAHVEEELHGNILEVKLHGKLTREDYLKWVPHSERLIRMKGKLRMLVELEDFHGWDAGAVWEEFKWDIKHFRDVERVAVVGETKWERWMTSFCKPFTTAEVRYFEPYELESARTWIGIA